MLVERKSGKRNGKVERGEGRREKGSERDWHPTRLFT
jgi:hypothetical protein